MKTLKSFLFFVIPLIIVLISLSTYSNISKVINEYKQTIINDYAIMIVANEPIDKSDIISINDIKIKDIKNLERDIIVENLKDELPENSLGQLKEKLPYFYQIYLIDYPSSIELKYIENELKKLQKIKRVETFSSDHSKTYSLLLLNGQMSKIIFILTSLFAIFILMKQVKIWFIENDRRITIIQYYGGSIFYGAMPIIKLALFSFVVILLENIFMDNLSLFLTPEIINIIPENIDVTFDYISIFIISFLKVV